jgi:hypothetical protein
MNFGADMMRDQAHDALAIGGDSRSPVSASPSASRSIQMRPSGSASPRRRPRLPEAGDGRAERGAQHPCTARQPFWIVLRNRHLIPDPAGEEIRRSPDGDD